MSSTYPFGTLLKGTLLPSVLREFSLMPLPTSTANTRWKPWQWRPQNQATALSNARAACVELSRRRVEREAVDIFIAQLEKDRQPPRASA